MASLLMASATTIPRTHRRGGRRQRRTASRGMNQSAGAVGDERQHLADPAARRRMSFGGGPDLSVYEIAIASRNAMTVPEIARWAGACVLRSSIRPA